MKTDCSTRLAPENTILESTTDKTVCKSSRQSRPCRHSKPIEVITSVERRRRRTDEEKARILAEAMQPGNSMLGTARKYDVAPRLLYHWKKKFFNFSRMPVPLSPAPRSPAVAPASVAKAVSKDGRPMATVEPPPRVFSVKRQGRDKAPNTEPVRLLIGDLVITIATRDSR